MGKGFTWYPGKQALVQRAFGSALAQTAQDVLDDINESGIVPRSGTARAGRIPGMLQESARVDQVSRAHVRIVYDTDYARTVYFHPSWRFRTDVNPNARSAWFEPYLAGGPKANFAHERYMRRLRQHGRGWLF